MRRAAPGAVRKRSVTIAGHRTSVSLEAAFWEALAEVAATQRMSVQALIGHIDSERAAQNLSSAIRVHVLACFRTAEIRRPDAATGNLRLSDRANSASRRAAFDNLE